MFLLPRTSISRRTALLMNLVLYTQPSMLLVSDRVLFEDTWGSCLPNAVWAQISHGITCSSQGLWNSKEAATWWLRFNLDAPWMPSAMGTAMQGYSAVPTSTSVSFGQTLCGGAPSFPRELPTPCHTILRFTSNIDQIACSCDV